MLVKPMADAGLAPMFYTFGGHPGACAAANAVLDIMEHEKLVERVAELGPVFEEKLSPLRNHEHVAEVRGRGFFWGIEIVKDKSTLERFERSAQVTNRIVGKGIAKGIFFYPGGTGEVRDIICLGPPFTLTESEMETIASVLTECVDEVISAI